MSYDGIKGYVIDGWWYDVFREGEKGSGSGKKGEGKKGEGKKGEGKKVEGKKGGGKVREVTEREGFFVALKTDGPLIYNGKMGYVTDEWFYPETTVDHDNEKKGDGGK